MIVAPDGRVINSLALIYCVREIEGIERFRIRQKTTTSFEIQVVRNGNFSDVSEDRIRRAWSSLLRGTVNVSFEYLPDLPLDHSGKFRHVVSDVKTSPVPPMAVGGTR